MIENPLALLRAPVSGAVVPLEQVPDPVFSTRMMGPGIAIDPTGDEIVAPCNGRISQTHPAGHAVGITTPWGAEILIHVGLDTVKLRGLGFDPVVSLHQEVKEGETLIRFDADLIARKSKSLLTEMIITNSDQFGKLEVLSAMTVRSGDPLLKLGRKGGQVSTQEASELGSSLKSEPITIHNSTGIHARPAAVLANAAKRFQSRLILVKAGQSADLRSLIAVMGLEVAQNDVVTLEASGTDAVEALATLVGELRILAEEHASAQSEPISEVTSAPVRNPQNQAKGVFAGVIAAPGVTAGVIFQLASQEIEVDEKGESVTAESARLEKAVAAARLELQALATNLRTEKDSGRAAIFEAHQELLEDPQLLEIAAEEISNGMSAAYAWKLAYLELSRRLQSLKNELLAARANDVRDIGKRVLQLLAGEQSSAPVYPDRCIVIAEDLTPSDVATLDRQKVLGFCTTTGGATSHVAILARSLDIPALAGMDAAILDIANGTRAVLDATRGELKLNPSAEALEKLEQLQARQEIQKKQDLAEALKPATTLDGHSVEIVANLKAVTEAEGAIQLGAEGVGLLRTEFLFMNRTTAPNEEEQFEAYRSIARAFGKDRPLIIRTLDVGGDKPLAYLPLPKEENPFLGERGIRVSLFKPEMFRTQLRAILRAAADGKIHLMFPMIASLAELRAARAILEEEREKLGVAPVPVGIMIEVPSAAIMAEKFAEECDFFSIGSNDLSQYTLAIDRGHPKLAAQADALDPAILRLIEMTVKGAHGRKKWTGVCGGIAGDPKAIPILMGLGVDELSVSIPAIPAIKAQIRRLNQKDCVKLAQAALQAGSAAEVRGLVAEFERQLEQNCALNTEGSLLS